MAGWLADTGLIRYKCGRSSSQVTCLPRVGGASLSSGDRGKNSTPGGSCNSVCAPPLPSLCTSSILYFLHPIACSYSFFT